MGVQDLVPALNLTYAALEKGARPQHRDIAAGPKCGLDTYEDCELASEAIDRMCDSNGCEGYWLRKHAEFSCNPTECAAEYQEDPCEECGEVRA